MQDLYTFSLRALSWRPANFAGLVQTRFMNVGLICKRTVATIGPEDAVASAARLMRDTHVGLLVVVSETRPGYSVPVGVITDRDIMIAVVANGRDAAALKVADVMTQPPVTAMLEDRLPETLQQMRRIRVRRLPVVGPDGHFVGVISVDDILAVLASEISTAAGALVHGRTEEAVIPL